MEKTNKIIVILGQTSTGKSDFAIDIATQINGEIISADSRQVYKGMDLSTGKITNTEMKGVEHYLLGVASPSKVFSVSDFQKQANKEIEKILRKGKIPIICGGTGFYIDAITNGSIFPKVEPNKDLRKNLSKKTAEELFIMLKKLDKDRAKIIDANNKVRLIRAIEIVKALGKVPKLSPRSDLGENKFKILKIGLTLPNEILKNRIRSRLLSRIKSGMIKEVENLHKKGLSWKRMYELGLEQRYVSIYLRKNINKEKMIEQLNTKIWHYAKRQKTWFKRDKDVIWIDPLNKSEKDEVLKRIEKFLNGSTG